MPNGDGTPMDWANHNARQAQQDANLANNQMERLLYLLRSKGILSIDEVIYIRRAPR
jgi:hypothetical protein